MTDKNGKISYRNIREVYWEILAINVRLKGLAFGEMMKVSVPKNEF